MQENQAKYQVRLEFIADTKGVKNTLNSLNTQLNSLMKGINLSQGFTSGIEKSISSAVSLQHALKQAVNVDTGSINFDRLSNSLKAAGQTVQSLGKNMASMGVQGVQAFGTFAKAVAQAEIPLRSSSTLANSLMKTLGNTIKWQLSSKAINMVTGSLRNAFQYAKDLDKILTNISIVSNMSKNQLELFAKEANKSAKLLGASTKEYMEASVIFFQQGLDVNEVKARTEAVMKMTKVTGEAASQVSSYMTAIWNNFDNGSKSLEYYADVITALGAATASSTEEIAGGLEKFASIAETVGLSYEYATAALATVVAETRQSEDTVGTSFKTIFGRLQSLNLGETLEDDTTLTKYSNALLAIGVNIKESNGDLKTMDEILNDIGSRWEQLTKDQQVALAYTVAGTRQYNNFIALMDSYSTSFKENLNIALEAQGSLDKQTEDYKAGWEATRQQVKASMEGIYDAFFNEDFFKDMNKFITPLLGAVQTLIRGLGGFNTIAPMLTTFFLTMFNDKVVAGMQNIAYNFDRMTGAAQKRAIAFKEAAINEYRNQAYNLTKHDTISSGQSASMLMHADVLEKRGRLEIDIFRNSKNISEEKKKELQTAIMLNEELEEQIINSGKIVDESSKAATQLSFTSGKNFKIGINKYDEVTDNNKTGSMGEITNLSKIDQIAQAAGLQSEDERLKKLRDINQQLQNNVLSAEEFKEKEKEVQAIEEQIAKAIQKRVFENGTNFKNKIQTMGLVNGEGLIDTRGQTADIAKQGAYVSQADSTIASLIEKRDLYLKTQNLTPELATEDQTYNNLNGLIQTLEKAKTEMQDATGDTNALNNAVNKFNNTLSQEQGSIDQVTQEFIEQQTPLLGSKEAAQELANKLLDVANGNVNMVNATKQSNAALDKMREKLKQAATAAGGMAQKITTAASSAMSLLTAVNSIRNVANIMNDESLSGWEKFSSLAMTTLMATTSIMSSINGISNLFGKVKLEDVNNKKAKEEDTASLKRHTRAVNQSAKADLKEAQASNTAATADQREAVQSNVVASGQSKGRVIKAKGNVGNLKPAANPPASVRTLSAPSSPPVQGGSPQTAAGASSGAGAAAGFGSIALWIAGIGVAIAAIAAIVAWYNKAENAAKKQEKIAKKAREQYKNVKTEYDELKTTISDYKDGKDALGTMIKGTDEWRDSIEKTNEKAKELINTYKNIGDIDLKYKVDENGVIQIDDESLKQIEDFKRQQTVGAELMALGAERRAQSARQDADLTKLKRKKLRGGEAGSAESWQAAGMGALGGAASGALIGTAISPGWGSLIGAGIGLTVGAVAGGLGIDIAGTQSKRENDAIDKITNALNTMSDEERAKYDTMDDAEYKTWLRDLGVENNDKLLKGLTEHKDALEELIDEERANREATIANTQALIMQNYDEELKGAANKEAAAKMMAIRQEAGYYTNQLKEEYNYNAIKNKTSFIDFVDDMSNGQYKVDRAGGNRARLWIQKDGKWERYEEGKKTSKEEIYELMLSLQEAEKLKGSTKDIVKEQNDAVAREAAALGETFNSLDDELKSFMGQAWVDYYDNDINTTVDVSKLSRRQANEIAQGNFTTEYGKAMKEAAANYDEYIRNKNKKETEEWLADTEERLTAERKEAQETLELSDEAYESYKEIIVETNAALAEQGDLVELLAIRNLDWNASFKTIHKALKENLQDLTSVQNHLSTDYLKALGNVKQAFVDAFGVSVSQDFIEKNLSDIIAAAEGNADATLRVVRGLNAEIIKNNTSLLEQDQKALEEIFNNEEGVLAGDNFEKGQSLTGNAAAEKIMQMVADGTINSETAQKLLTNAGFLVQLDNNGNIDLANTVYQGTEALFANNEKLIDKEYNSLYQVNRELEKAEKRYEKAGKAKSKVFGAQYLEAINEERDALSAVNDELVKYNEQLAIDQANAKEEMDKYFQDRGIQLNYNEHGNIIGYTDTETGSIVEGEGWYNSLMTGKFQFGSDEAEKYISSYDELSDKIDETNDKIQDNTDSLSDLDLEEVSYAVEHAAERTELSNSMLERELKGLKDGIEYASSRNRIYEQQADNALLDWQSNYAGYLGIMSEIDSEIGPTAQQLEALKKYQEGMVTAEEQINQLVQTYRDEFVKAIEDGTVSIQDQIKIIDSLNTTLSKYTSIIDLLGKSSLDNKNALQIATDEAALEVAKAAFIANQEYAETTQQNLEYAKSQVQQARGSLSEGYEDMMEQIEHWEEESISATNATLSSFENLLEAATTLFKNNISRAIESMQSALSEAYGSFDFMTFTQEQQKELKDMYLEDYEQEYAISKLLRELGKTIDNTDDIQGKQRLRELEGKINETAARGNTIAGERKNLTQAQVDLMQKEYELELARIALQDAQNRKTQVQLKQSASGAWSYVYTADQEKIEQAEQEMETKMYELSKLKDDLNDEYMQSILDLENAFGNEIQQILDMEFETTEQQINAIVAYVQNALSKLATYTNGLTAIGNTEATTMYNNIAAEFLKLSDTVQAEIWSYDDIKETAKEMLGGAEGLEEYMSKGISATTKQASQTVDMIKMSTKDLESAYINLSNQLLTFEDNYYNIMKNIKDVTTDTFGQLKTYLSDDLVKMLGLDSSTVHVNLTGLSFAASPSAYDTGGYTGAWGSSGKLAVLHEKELVLNKDDTSNFLQMVELLNNLTNDQLMNLSIPTFSNMVANAKLEQATKEAVEQMVTIHAEFPNATKHSEIEQAFENIINMATQYAYRK